ncbi:ATP synthase F1 subunit gamma [Candidatus Peregrinibacteria bacterium]|nr:ATP synthase F1 subunit gamma [Candidatus Peregrinibacteria bacterium]
MAKGTREIRRKIKSIKNTRQITKAMEMVAASKMRKAVAGTLMLRPYARLAQALLRNLSDKTVQTIHPLLAQREVKKVLVVMIAPDRGLCGGLNTQLFRKLNYYLKAEKKKAQMPEIAYIAVGKKAQDFLRRSGKQIVAAYNAISAHPTLKDTFAISKMVLSDYTLGAYDKVMLVYTDFVSVINQKPTVRRLLPLSRHALEEMVEGIDTEAHQTKIDTQAEAVAVQEYKFEPSPDTVLEMLLPRLTEMQIFQAILEATASEHSARMFAMRNATDSATEIIDDLTLLYNQLRQASITAELAEISAGRAVLG